MAAVVPLLPGDAAAESTPLSLLEPTVSAVFDVVETSTSVALTTVSLEVRTTESTATGRVAAPPLQVPDGGVRVMTCLGALPSGYADPVSCQTAEPSSATERTVVPPTVEVTAVRPADGTSLAFVGFVKVDVWTGSQWKSVASSWPAGGVPQLEVPPDRPTTNTADFSLLDHGTGQALGTVRLASTAVPTHARAVISSDLLKLPPGRLRLQTCLGALPATRGESTRCTTEVVKAGSSRNQDVAALTLRATRSLDGSGGNFIGFVNVHRWEDRSWKPVASSWPSAGQPALEIPPADGPTEQHRGSNVHLFWADADLADIAKDLDRLSEAGASSVRTAFPWALLQPDPTAEFDEAAVARIDAFLDLTEARGLSVLAIFGSTPCWASSAPEAVKQDCATGMKWASYPPKDDEVWAAAAGEFSARFGHRLMGVELRNEPNHEAFFVGTPADYARIVKVGYSAMKRAQPDLTVVAGAIALADSAYLSALYSEGIRGHYDVLSVHPYHVRFDDQLTGTGPPLVPWPDEHTGNSFAVGLADMRRVMEANGDGDTPLWVTEFGFSNCQSSSELCVTDQEQADWLSESLRLAARWDSIDAVFTYLVRDTGVDTQRWNDNFGLVRADHTSKPAYDAFAETLACLRAGTC